MEFQGFARVNCNPHMLGIPTLSFKIKNLLSKRLLLPVGFTQMCI